MWSSRFNEKSDIHMKVTFCQNLLQFVLKAQFTTEEGQFFLLHYLRSYSYQWKQCCGNNKAVILVLCKKTRDNTDKHLCSQIFYVKVIYASFSSPKSITYEQLSNNTNYSSHKNLRYLDRMLLIKDFKFTWHIS